MRTKGDSRSSEAVLFDVVRCSGGKSLQAEEKTRMRVSSGRRQGIWSLSFSSKESQPKVPGLRARGTEKKNIGTRCSVHASFLSLVCAALCTDYVFFSFFILAFPLSWPR